MVAPARGPQDPVQILCWTVIVLFMGWSTLSELLGPTYGSSSPEETRMYLVKHHQRALREACDHYRRVHGTWPPTLGELIHPEQGRPFLRELCLDPWRNEYRMAGFSESGLPIVISAGKDREYGTEDDLTTEKLRDLWPLPHGCGP